MDAQHVVVGQTPSMGFLANLPFDFMGQKIKSG
jgi:hypothetical protein